MNRDKLVDWISLVDPAVSTSSFQKALLVCHNHCLAFFLGSPLCGASAVHSRRCDEWFFLSKYVFRAKIDFQNVPEISQMSHV